MTDVTHVPSDRRTATGDAVAAMDEAWKSIQEARGHAYEYHRHAGMGDAHLVRAVALLRTAGHHDLADAVCHHLVGHGVAEDRWSFQVVEEHEDDFVRTLMTLEEQVRARSQIERPGQAG
jgi:hypothetical protein